MANASVSRTTASERGLDAQRLSIRSIRSFVGIRTCLSLPSRR
jgi:hypothetical protein